MDISLQLNSMKILTVATVKDVFFTLPRSEQNKLLEATVRSMIEVKKKLGDKVQFYTEIGSGRTVSIGEHASLEEYTQCLSSPLSNAGLANYETHVLLDLDEKAMKAYADSLKSAK